MTSDKTRVLVLGSGWAATAFIKKLDLKTHDVECISPYPYFLFQPLLPSVVGGSLNPSSAITHLNDLFNPKVKYTKGEATAINTDNKLVTLQSGEVKSYDVLVHAVGTTPNTFGIKGVKEYAFFLKEFEHAKLLRARVTATLHECSLGLSTMSHDELRKKLHFVFIGAGPTGIETMSEIADVILKKFSTLIPFTQLTMVEMVDRLLPAMDAATSECVLQHFKEGFPDGLVSIQTNSSLMEMDEDSITIKTKGPLAETKIKASESKDIEGGRIVKMPAGTVVWGSGITQRAITKSIMEAQKAMGFHPAPAVRVGSDLKALGFKDMFVLGDCAFIQPYSLALLCPSILREVTTFTVEKLRSALLKKERYDYYPQTDLYDQVLGESAELVGDNSKEMWSPGGTRSKIESILKAMDMGYKSPPPTAQVAGQQGEFLGDVFNKHSYATIGLPGFRWINKGSLCYVGNHRAVLHVGNYSILPSQRMSGYAWRAVYTIMQPNLKKKFNVALDFLSNLYS